MDPDKCSDFVRDEETTNAGKSKRLSDLMATAWKLESVKTVKRYDDKDKGFVGWAMWKKNNSDAP